MDTLSATTPNAARTRSLLPKEHGAWPQLLLPMTTALVASPSRAGVLVALAAIAGFLAHEPALVLRGTRGDRARDRERSRARRWLAFALASALTCSLTALVASQVAAWRVVLAAVPSVLLSCALAWMVRTNNERTDMGECLAATALTSVVVAISVAGGASVQRALSMWLVWSVGFIAITGAVRTAMAGAKKRDPRPSRRIAVMGTVIAVALVPLTAGATLVSALSAGALLRWPPAPKDIRRAGWTLAFGSLATAAWLVAATRLS